jgi:hypothetical protein
VRRLAELAYRKNRGLPPDMLLAKGYICEIEEIQEALREAGLVDVLEAGQAMREFSVLDPDDPDTECCEQCDKAPRAWDAAVTRLAGEGKS